MKTQNGLKVKCNFCGYSWEYGGSKTIYVSCPNCKRNVKIGELKAEAKNRN